jgi:hypothetical protein
MARPEVTGRKVFPGVDEAAVYTIPQFLKAHNISYGKFYQMCKQGLGPRMMKYGTRRVISVEDAARWREERAKAKE